MKFTRLGGLGVATVAVAAWSAPAMADGHDAEERIASMEQRIKYLEERVASQDEMIVDKEGEMAGLSEGWFNSVEIAGLVEVSLTSSMPAEDDSSTDMELATLELGVAAAINDQFSAEVLVENDDGTIALADAFLTYDAGGGLSATGGLQILPFGVYDTNLISDPLTLMLGETGDVGLVLAGDADLLSWSLFSFDVQNKPEDESNIAGFGAGLGFAAEANGAEFGLNLSWINHVGDSGEIGGAEPAFAELASGMAASATGRLGAASVMIETVSVLDPLDAEGLDGAQPSAWAAEIAYDLDLMGSEATAAFAAGGSDEAEALGLPETLMLVGVSVAAWENVGITLEWKQEEAYSADDADNAITVLLSAEF